MPRLMPKKVMAWLLVATCFFSFGGGLGRAVICFDRHGCVELELLYSGDHCLTEHLQGRHKHHGHNHQEDNPGQKNVFNCTSTDCCCSACDDIEVSLQLFAPRRKQLKSSIDFSVKPIFQPSTCTPLVISTKTIAPNPAPLSVPDPSIALLQSVILLI
ncbi:MAG: hypothetical protein U9Q58_08990 [Pseudomonadota bacterium]|nr:hypothetical protein [Pseudomonadota bacterium]